MDTKDAVTALAALAQGSRLAAFRMLVELGPVGANPTDLAERLDIPANTLSFHLKTLAQADLITAEPSGRSIRYRANFEQMRGLVDFLTRNCCGGDASLCEPSSSSCAPKARVRAS